MTSPDYSIRINATRAATYLIGAAGLIGAIGALLPWATLSAPFVGTVSKNGIDGDGVFAVVLGILLMIYAVIRVAWSRAHWTVATVLSLALLGLAIFEIADVYRTAADVHAGAGNLGDDPLGVTTAIANATTVSVGVGLWLDALAGLAALGGAILLASVARRPVATPHRPYPVQNPSHNWPPQTYRPPDTERQ